MLNPPPIDDHILSVIHLAVREDLGMFQSSPSDGVSVGIKGGDLTVNLAIPPDLQTTGTIVARRPGTLSGTFLLATLLHQYSPHLSVKILCPDGTRLSTNHMIAEISGPARALLSAERVLLNFLGHLSGIATLTSAYVDAVARAVPDPALRPAICDTRKTTPAFRVLDKYAVRCGGGINHRIGLYDGVMLKDNHLVALRQQLGPGLTLAQLTTAIRPKLDPSVTLWLEVDTLDQLREALPGGGADIILLDNFTPDQMREAVGIP